MNKKIIIIRTTIVVILFFLLFLLAFVVDNFVAQTPKEDGFVPQTEDRPFQMEEVKEYSAFFNVVNDLNSFLNYHQKRNVSALLAVLHPQFLQENNINSSNVMRFLDDYGVEQLGFKAKEMYFQKDNNNYLYYVKGDVKALLYESEEVIKSDVSFLVAIDYDNITYAIYPLKDEQKEKLPLVNTSIEPNDYNQFMGTEVITNNYICNLYYSEFYNILNTSPIDTYDLLEQEFKEGRYKNANNYENYIEKKLPTITSEIAECQVEEKNGQRVYTIKDQNYNIFTFTEEKIMDYKVTFSLS